MAVIKILAPILPFVTEHMYKNISKKIMKVFTYVLIQNLMIKN